MTKDEVLKLAMEALVRADRISGYPNNKDTITAISEALVEQPANQVDDIDVVDIPAQQCQHQWKNISSKRQTVYQCETCGIYTFEKPWVGLTEDDIEYPYPPAKPPVYATAMNTKAVRDGFELGGYEKEAGYYSEAQLDEFARTIEAKLKDKNNG